MLTALLPRASAQVSDPMYACINVGKERLESLLTNEQKQSVIHLTITGTLQEEDYAYLRNDLIKKLVELNLRDADIVTPFPPMRLTMDVTAMPDRKSVLFCLSHLSTCLIIHCA